MENEKFTPLMMVETLLVVEPAPYAQVDVTLEVPNTVRFRLTAADARQLQEALGVALAQLEQEPVGWPYGDDESE